MTINIDAGGQTVGTKHIATLRLQGDSTLDVEVTADGSKTVLEMIKEIAANLADAAPDGSADWSELSVVPASGSVVKISLGVLAEHSN